MDRIKNIEQEKQDIDTRYKVPLFYRYMIKVDLKENKIPLKQNKIAIEFYKVEAFEPYSFYRPISKIQ